MHAWIHTHIKGIVLPQKVHTCMHTYTEDAPADFAFIVDIVLSV